MIYVLGRDGVLIADAMFIRQVKKVAQLKKNSYSGITVAFGQITNFNI